MALCQAGVFHARVGLLDLQDGGLGNLDFQNTVGRVHQRERPTFEQLEKTGTVNGDVEWLVPPGKL